MGSVFSSPLSIACTFFPVLVSVVQGQLTKRQTKALEQVKDRAPHILKPPKNEHELAFERANKIRTAIIGIIILILILVVTITPAAIPEQMKWAFFFDIDTYAYQYQITRYAGLGCVSLAFLLMYYHHVAHMARLSYVSQYWNIPIDLPITSTGLSFLYAQRDDKRDLESLCSGIYFFVRDPDGAANNVMFIGVVATSCSWLLFIVLFAITLLSETMVVKKDIMWSKLYGPIYDVYRLTRGGQFYCTCLNPQEAAFEQWVRNKLAALAEMPNQSTAKETTMLINARPAQQSDHVITVENEPALD